MDILAINARIPIKGNLTLNFMKFKDNFQAIPFILLAYCCSVGYCGLFELDDLSKGPGTPKAVLTDQTKAHLSMLQTT